MALRPDGQERNRSSSPSHLPHARGCEHDRRPLQRRDGPAHRHAAALAGGSRGAGRYRVYQCYSWLRDVASPLPSDAVDQAALMALETRGVSVEETRAQVAEALALEVRTVVARAAEAEREYRQARGALNRVDRDYGSADLSPANHKRLMAKFTPECEAAEAQRAELDAHADDLRRIADAADDALIGDLAALREDCRASRRGRERRRGPIHVAAPIRALHRPGPRPVA